VKSRVAALAPVAEGEKVTSILQEALGARVNEVNEEQGLVPLVALAKSPGFVPPIAILVTFKVAVPLLLI
jgi:hypothetical protein